MYDKDGSGTIELAEMVTVIGTLYDMEGINNQRYLYCIEINDAKAAGTSNRSRLKGFLSIRIPLAFFGAFTSTYYFVPVQFYVTY